MDIRPAQSAPQTTETTRLPEDVERKAGLLPSHGIEVAESRDRPAALGKPPLLKHVSSPAYNSPLRHRRKEVSTPKHVKESLNARSEYVTSEDDGAAEHRINQYIIKQEIGRGSFGAVHLATDQFGTEYAVKEFSKARLRKRAQSHILRKPLAQRRRGSLQGLNSPLHRQAGMGQDASQVPNSIDLIKEEIAIMKKLNHPNIVSLIEVLDDPTEDSLYMVMEMCKKGVVMKVGLEERADPYADEICRCWFRDLILGIEYLHAQGIVHRDIKPDNCLITDDDVLKVVDFGVSEMFEKDSEMMTTKSAGSPAFLPPELCVARHGDVSAKAADIWSMGVTLYCLKYGRIPFEKNGIFDLYESIKSDQFDLPGESDERFRDMISKVLEKDPAKRIKMGELREHPWVTNGGEDPLLPEKENISNLVEPPTEAEMNAAITSNMRNLMTVIKAVNKFKGLVANKRPPVMESILGDQGPTHFSEPPGSLTNKNLPLPYLAHKSKSVTTFDRDQHEGMLVAEGVHRDLNPEDQKEHHPFASHDGNLPPDVKRDANVRSDPPPLVHATSEDLDEMVTQLATADDVSSIEAHRLPPFRSKRRWAQTVDEVGTRGHAHDPLEDHLFLFVGPSTYAGPSAHDYDDDRFVPGEDDIPIVSESPGAADMDIYETAYRDEIERIMAEAREHEKEPNVYLTRRVDEKLLAISGLAGKWMAVGEEAKNQIKDYTQFSARKARVTEVSRALREAARAEYDKKKAEHRSVIAVAKLEKQKAKSALMGDHGSHPSGRADEVPSQTGILTAVDDDLSGETSYSTGGRSHTHWKGKATDKGRRARTSFLGLVDVVKKKAER